MNLGKIVIILTVIASFAISLYTYPQLPDQIATHWNGEGKVNDYSQKLLGSFLIPVMLLLFSFLFVAIPKIDPLKKNFKKFINYYEWFFALLFVFILATHTNMLLWNLGFEISPIFIMSIGIGAIFFYAGILLDHAKRNWFVGIRNPWTLSSDKVWNKTHKKASILFKIAGIIAVASIFIPQYFLLLIMGPIILILIYTTIYSWQQYNKN